MPNLGRPSNNLGYCSGVKGVLEKTLTFLATFFWRFYLEQKLLQLDVRLKSIDNITTIYIHCFFLWHFFSVWVHFCWTVAFMEFFLGILWHFSPYRLLLILI